MVNNAIVTLPVQTEVPPSMWTLFTPTAEPAVENTQIHPQSRSSTEFPPPADPLLQQMIEQDIQCLCKLVDLHPLEQRPLKTTQNFICVSQLSVVGYQFTLLGRMWNTTTKHTCILLCVQIHTERIACSCNFHSYIINSVRSSHIQQSSMEN